MLPHCPGAAFSGPTRSGLAYTRPWPTLSHQLSPARRCSSQKRPRAGTCGLSRPPAACGRPGRCWPPCLPSSTAARSSTAGGARKGGSVSRHRVDAGYIATEMTDDRISPARSCTGRATSHPLLPSVRWLPTVPVGTCALPPSPSQAMISGWPEPLGRTPVAGGLTSQLPCGRGQCRPPAQSRRATGAGGSRAPALKAATEGGGTQRGPAGYKKSVQG